ncbi:hypothetical protein [Cryptosporangium phraense]|uniref:Uncharacterized protein n=1 Tax=Cryptosporangium phraense TaxID=2593070 RepID=A0A545ARA6_9ACTN|nr:hypothetical protein [Cryptosporangium phraense]TQS43842.1 hypothetical protein FL583_17615 [Cryptosporangium phraense]
MSAPPMSRPMPPTESVTEPIPGAAGRLTARGSARAGTPTATVGDLLTVVGGLLVLAFSKLPFVSYTDGRYTAIADRADLPTSWTAWTSATFLAPLSWVAILAAVVAAVLGVLRVFRRDRFGVLGLRPAQVRVLLSSLTLLILFCLGVSSKTVMFGDDRPATTSTGIKVTSTLSLDLGGYLMLLAAVVLLLGTVLTASGAGGAVLWPPPSGVRQVFMRTPGGGTRRRRPEPQADAYPAPPIPGYGPPGGYGPPRRY